MKSAVDTYGYSTLAIDRLGIGQSSTADPLNVVQAPATISTVLEITRMLRAGRLPGVHTSFDKVVHIGHSYGSLLTYELVAMYPDVSDGIILTGFSHNLTYVNTICAAMD